MLPKTQSLRSWIDFCLGILGLIAAVVGWHFDHVEHFEWLQRLIAPRYFAAMQLYDHIAASRRNTSELSAAEAIRSALRGQNAIRLLRQSNREYRDRNRSMNASFAF